MEPFPPNDLLDHELGPGSDFLNRPGGGGATHPVRSFEAPSTVDSESLDRDTTSSKGCVIHIREAAESKWRGPALIKRRFNEEGGWKDPETATQLSQMP